MDPTLRNSLFVLGGTFLMVFGAIIGNIIMSRTSLPQMAKNAFDMATSATDRLKKWEEDREKERADDQAERERERVLFRDEIEKMRALLSGQMKITGFANAGNLLKDGYVPIEGGRIELLIKKEIPDQILQDVAE